MKPLGLGDIVMMSPLLLLLKNRYRTAKIFLISDQPKFLNIPDIKWIHPKKFDKKRLKNFLVISPTLTWKHIPFIFYANQFIGYFFSTRVISNFSNVIECYDPKKNHFFDKAYPLIKALNLNSKNLQYPPILLSAISKFDLPLTFSVFAPYSAWDEKQYPIENLIKLISEVLRNSPVVLLGSSNFHEITLSKKIEKFFNNKKLINLVGKTSLTEASSIILKAALFVGNDSGPSHIAYYREKPTITIFGCVKSQNILPLNPKVRKNIFVYEASHLCSFHPCYDGFNKPFCKNENKYVCLTGINHTNLINHCVKLINRS
jgi:ADP-heptose:LPS heptosyltransferase